MDFSATESEYIVTQWLWSWIIWIKLFFCTENCLKLPSVVSSNPFARGNFLCDKTWARFIVSSESHCLLGNSFSMKLLYTWFKRIFTLFFYWTVSVVLRSVCGRYLKLYYYKIRHNNMEVWNSWVTKSSHKIELSKMTSHFELLTRTFLYKCFFELLTRLRKRLKFHFELLTRKLKFYFSTFELLSLTLL